MGILGLGWGQEGVDELGRDKTEKTVDWLEKYQ